MKKTQQATVFKLNDLIVYSYWAFGEEQIVTVCMGAGSLEEAARSIARHLYRFKTYEVIFPAEKGIIKNPERFYSETQYNLSGLCGEEVKQFTQLFNDYMEETKKKKK